MIIGKKHEWCGRINWNGTEECTCRPFGNSKRIYQFTDVIFNNPVVEELGRIAGKLADKMKMNIDIGYDLGQDNLQGEVVGALIIDGWITIYPERFEVECILGKETRDGFALDVSHTIHNYPSEPDEVEVTRYKWDQHPMNVISAALRLVFELELANSLEALAYEKTAALEE